MKVEELIGSKVWIKTDQFRSVPGKITSTSNAINQKEAKSSVRGSLGSRWLLGTSLRSSVPIFQRLKMPAIRQKPRCWRRS